jgi:glycosyltransferase involved in cell wall biosynthesis
MPMSVMEAMAAGCPVIATNVGGSAELVTDHESGILVPPAESAPLADAIIELLGDTGARTRFAERAKVLLQTQFTARTMVQAYRQMYAKASPAGGRITSHRHGALDRKSQ